MSYYADNTPAYYTSRPPALQEVEYEIVAKGPVEETDPEDMCEPTRQVVFVKPLRVHGAEGGLTGRDMASLLARNLSPARCYCEHDCCGHRHGYAQVEILTLDCIRVTISTSRNY